MFEVKITVDLGVKSVRTFTIATFEVGGKIIDARKAAIAFAKQIDPEFEVSVTKVEDENDRDRAFGLVWAHVPGDSSRMWDGVHSVSPDTQF